MSEVKADIVVGCDVRTASSAWRDFDFRQDLGGAAGPLARVKETAEQQYADKEYITFEDRGEGNTLVTLTVEYEEDEVKDVATLRADVENELARYRRFVETRAA